MPQGAWNEKRERQYEHIKSGLRERGMSEDKAEEIAARTVNKERARAGEARESSLSAGGHLVRPAQAASLRGRARDARAISSTRRPDQNIKGRSKMSKAQLQRAVDRRT